MAKLKVTRRLIQLVFLKDSIQIEDYEPSKRLELPKATIISYGVAKNCYILVPLC